MKMKKILTMLSSVAIAATLGVSALAGCDKGGGHVHAYQEIDRQEATCVAPGLKTLKCVCGDARNEEIPVNPDAHDYDEWDITKYPTDSAKGAAVRTCKLNSSHTVSATLPKLSEENSYVSHDITVKPTSISTGVRHYVYAHSSGAVEFDIELPKRGVENVEDAVILGSSLHDLVRQSSGRYIEGGDPDDPKFDPNSPEYDPEAKLSTLNFSNYYGDNYVHVHDDGNRDDFWYSRDEDGKPFGVSATVERVLTNPIEGDAEPPAGYEPIYENVPRDPAVKTDVTEQDLLGFRYESGGGMKATYGAEDTLLTYYNASQSNSAVKYDDHFVKESNGEYNCWFEFSRRESGSGHFCRYRVEFTLYASGAIKTLSVRTKIIRSFMLANSFNGTNTGETIYDKDGDIIFGEIYPIDTTTGADLYEIEYEKDETGNIVYEYTYVTDEDGKIMTDESGKPIIAVDEDGNQIKSPKVKSILIEGIKLKPDGTPLLDRLGNEIARPVPQGWKDGDKRTYYYEEGDKKYDGTDDVYTDDHPFIAIRNLIYEQTLKVEGEKVEVNPYPADSVYIRSFDVTYNDAVIGEEDVVEIKANTPVTFEITNVQPAATAKLDYDPLKVFLLTPSGTEIELSYTGDVDYNQNAYHIVGYFNTTNQTVFLNAQYAGEMTVILRTLSGRCERQIKLNIAKGNPTAFTAQVYTYSDAGGTEEHIWTAYDEKTSDPITLYVGQSLYVRAAPVASEANYVDDRFVTSVGSKFVDCFTLEDNLELPDGTKVSKITPLQVALDNSGNPRSVTVYIDSVAMNAGAPTAYTTIKIIAAEPPAVEGMFSGEYVGRFKLIGLVPSNNLLKPANVTITVVPDSGAATVSGKFNVAVTDGTNNATSVYSYSYDPATKKLTCAYVSGRNDDTFKFEFALNEVYKLSITHPTYKGRTETVVLSRPQTN